MITVQTYNAEGQLVPFDLGQLGICAAAWQRWLRRVAADHGFQVGAVNYILCSDQKELEVNQQFLGHDYYTDVITFDYTAGSVVSGDIFMSVDMIRENAAMAQTTYTNEMLRIFAHALLHLTGQGDKTPESKAQMTQKEDAALSRLDGSIFLH